MNIQFCQIISDIFNTKYKTLNLSPKTRWAGIYTIQPCRRINPRFENNRDLLNAKKLAKSINNTASLNNTIVETLKIQNYRQTPQIIKRKKTISPPQTNTFSSNTGLNAIFKENTPRLINIKMVFESIPTRISLRISGNIYD